jgi:multicomponent K+:H+ antiporter subunit E
VARRLATSTSRARRPLLIAKLCGRAVGDMVKANAEVAWVLLTRRSRDIRSRFVPIPLELADPAGLSILAMIVTFTPGTAWVELSLDKQLLLLHVFDTRDDALVVSAIKGRYEHLLKEIFE